METASRSRIVMNNLRRKIHQLCKISSTMSDGITSQAIAYSIQKHYISCFLIIFDLKLIRTAQKILMHWTLKHRDPGDQDLNLYIHTLTRHRTGEGFTSGQQSWKEESGEPSCFEDNTRHTVTQVKANNISKWYVRGVKGAIYVRREEPTLNTS